MDYLKMMFEQVRRMFGGLTTSQKLVGWLLAILVAVALVWMLNAAGKPEVVNVFDTPLPADELLAAEQAIRASGVKVDTADGLLTVSAADLDKARMILLSEDILPPDGSADLQKLALTPSMWRTEKDAERIWSYARQKEIAAKINAMPGVKKAGVLVQAGQLKRLGSRAIEPTAAVSVWLERGVSLDRRMRRAVADLVTPAVPGLKRSKISIIDATHGKSYHVSEDEEDNDERLDSIAQLDKYYEQKIRKALENIPGVIVSVASVPDTTRDVTTEKHQYDEPVSGKLGSASEMMQGAGTTPSEPGVLANTNGKVRLPAGGGGSSSESSETALALRFPETYIRKTERGGVLKELSAAVSVPRSFLVGAYRTAVGDEEAEPADADIQAHLDRIRDRVMTAANIKDAKLVKVDWIVEAPLPTVVETAEAGIVGTLVDHGKPVALGTLAVMALVMVMMFARRRHPDPPVMESPFSAGGLLDTTVGEVDGGEGALEGVELDEDAIRTQRVVEQVGEMVRERPDSATNLLRRWIEQG